MRIAYVVGSYPSRSETFIAREIEALAAHGLEIEVFPIWRARGEPPGAASACRVHAPSRSRVLREFLRPYADLRCIWRSGKALLHDGVRFVRAWWEASGALEMARRMQALGVERVHAHFANAPSTVAWGAAELADLPFSFSVHARDVFVEAEAFAEKARAAYRIVACNSAAARRAAELAGPDDRSKIALVPHGLPLASHPFRPRAPSGEPLVLGVGRLVEKKGFVHLVRAVARLRERVADARCWLIGDGRQRRVLSREIGKLGLRETVELKGWLPHDQVAAAYEKAWVLAVPSVVARDGDMDGLPNVVVEAAAAGVPIVATNVGGIGDLVRDGETGLVARPGEPEDLALKIRDVLSDPEAAMVRARRARGEVEARFDQAQTTAQLLEALDPRRIRDRALRPNSRAWPGRGGSK